MVSSEKITQAKEVIAMTSGRHARAGGIRIQMFINSKITCKYGVDIETNTSHEHSTHPAKSNQLRLLSLFQHGW